MLCAYRQGMALAQQQVVDLKLFPGTSCAISAIGLFFLAILHLIFNHVTTDVACTSYQLVALRYANPYWRVFDWLLLTLALLHGMNGLRVVIDDYVGVRAWRIRLVSLVGAVVLTLFMIGTVTLITFQPVVGSLGPHCLK